MTPTSLYGGCACGSKARGRWRTYGCIDLDHSAELRDHDIDATTARGEERNQDQSEPTANAMNDDETTCDTAGPVSPDRTTSYGRPTRAPGEWWCATAATEPTMYADAMSDPKWRAAIQEELQNHQDKGTWEIVEMPSGDINLVSTKWIFKVKSDGRHKARLVARGFTQQYGIDWHESYAPVTSTLIVRVFAAIACARAWLLHHIDVRAAYLCANVDESIYLSPPVGVNVPEGKV